VTDEEFLLKAALIRETNDKILYESFENLGLPFENLPAMTGLPWDLTSAPNHELVPPL
jgi:hypothetical protein